MGPGACLDEEVVLVQDDGGPGSPLQAPLGPEGPRGERPLLRPGTVVRILNPFVPSWSDGFEIAAVNGEGYLVRRLIDGHVLPRPFAARDVEVVEQPARRWW